jgi:hypothetical protein
MMPTDEEIANQQTEATVTGLRALSDWMHVNFPPEAFLAAGPLGKGAGKLEEEVLLAGDELLVLEEDLIAAQKATEAAELTHAFNGFLKSEALLKSEAEAEAALGFLNRCNCTGALVTEEGTLVTAGTRGLTAEQAWFAESQGYKVIEHLRGLHAEPALTEAASRLGLTPLALHTSWNTCAWCTLELAGKGWQLVLPSLRTWIYRGP